MSTYLNLVNKLLIKLNENELTESNFVGVRGVYASAKDAINDSLREIESFEQQWPYNAVEHTESLTIGTYEYAYPILFKTVDWNSFQIEKDDSLGVNSKTLKIMERDEWYKKYRDLDDDAGSDGRAIPDYVFKTHGNGYGLTPSPDQDYVLKYRYYTYFSELTDYDDECLVPEAFNHVIINGALKYMYVYHDNVEMANYVDDKMFQPNLKMMRKLLINDEQYVRDTRVNF